MTHDLGVSTVMIRLSRIEPAWCAFKWQIWKQRQTALNWAALSIHRKVPHA
jgi:hypothetical protein